MGSLSKGDKVRFISTKGGGVVSRIDSKGVVYVAIEDGFEIPCQGNDLVVIQSDESASKIFNRKNEFAKVDKPQPKKEEKIVEKPQLQNNIAKPDKGIYCAFVPENQNLIVGGGCEIYIVNYTTCEAFVRFMLFNPKNGFRTVKTAILTSGEALHLANASSDDISKWAFGKIQCLFVDKKKERIFSDSIVDFNIKDQKFLKEDNFKNNLFFDERAFIVPILYFSDVHEADNIDAEKIESSIEDNRKNATVKKEKCLIDKYIVDANFAEVDLHIEKIRSDYRKLPEEEIIRTQISWFKQCLDSAIERGLNRVVFIHGVGVGILKMEIRKIMQNYPDLKFADASILKYGVGATEVILN